MKKFAENLEIAIKNKQENIGHKITNQDIGKAIGTVGANVWRWRNGITKRAPSNYIVALANYLDVSADWLEHHDESVKLTTHNNKMNNKRSIVDLSSLYKEYRNVGDIESAISNSQYRFFDILPHLNNYLNIFATIVVTDCLSPRFNIGDAILVAPKETVSKGDSIIVVGEPNQSIFNATGHQLAELIFISKEHIIIRFKDNDALKEHKIDSKDFIEMHKILTLNSIMNIEKQ